MRGCRRLSPTRACRGRSSQPVPASRLARRLPAPCLRESGSQLVQPAPVTARQDRPRSGCDHRRRRLRAHEARGPVEHDPPRHGIHLPAGSLPTRIRHRDHAGHEPPVCHLSWPDIYLGQVGRAVWFSASDCLRPGRTGPDMPGSAAKNHVIHPFQKRLVNPVVKLAWALGIPPPGDALLETTGRRTGLARRTPVCDGLDGQTFWLIAQSGRHADWIQNIEADPRVRVKVASWPRTRRRAGTAHVLDDDDPRAAGDHRPQQPRTPALRGRLRRDRHQPANSPRRPGSAMMLTGGEMPASRGADISRARRGVQA
jgi:deazaflavin-dependent oxidoreductase (nitroreductase family)